LEQGLLHSIHHGHPGLSRGVVHLIQMHIIWISDNKGVYRFSAIEALTTLVPIVLHYRIQVLAELQFVHKTLRQRERLLEVWSGAGTLTSVCVPLQLIRCK